MKITEEEILLFTSLNNYTLEDLNTFGIIDENDNIILDYENYRDLIINSLKKVEEM